MTVVIGEVVLIVVVVVEVVVEVTNRKVFRVGVRSGGRGVVNLLAVVDLRGRSVTVGRHSLFYLLTHLRTPDLVWSLSARLIDTTHGGLRECE